MTDDADNRARLDRLKQAQQRDSARDAALRRMLESQGTDIEDKIAAVKTVQKTNRPRVLSAFTSLLNQDDDKAG